MAFFKKFRRRKKTRTKYPTYGNRRPPRLESKRHAGEDDRKTSHKAASRGRRPAQRRSSGGFRQFVKKCVIYGAVFGTIILGWLIFTLPDIDDLNKFTKAPSILVKAENGKIIGSFGDIYGDYVPFDQLPTSLVDAVMATEDRNFYHHFGIDPLGLARAMIANFRAGRVVQGGSTITQQVAKNVFLTPERSLVRKLKEMLLAFKLEKRFTKQDIMSIYMNRVYLGAGNYGVDAASRRYFGKSARDISLPESAILAGLLKAPSRFAPTSNPALSKKRASQVLLNMEDAKYLTKKQTQRALTELEEAMKGRQRDSQSSMYFADWIADQLPEYIGNVQDDMVVTTTLNPDMQAMGDKAITEVMDKESEKANASQAALLAMTPDGAVRVMIGGRSYGTSQFNRTVQSFRQPGSSFKLFVYLAGLEAGLTPSTLVEDEPITISVPGGRWTPKNYTGKYEGEITIKQAVTESINTVAVRVAQEVGVDSVVTVAHRLGVNSELDPVPSIALGSTEVSLLEMTTAYGHLAANGSIVIPYGILQIETTGGEIVYERKGGKSGRVLSSGVVGMMNDMLMSVVTSGTGRRAQIGRPVAGKTGTTSDYKDAWFMGFTPDLVAGVWVGNDDNAPMKKVTGGGLPAGIWHNFMQEATANMPVRGIPTEATDDSALPWNPENEFPAVNEGVGERDGNAHERDRDVELGPSFWNKLMR